MVAVHEHDASVVTVNDPLPPAESNVPLLVGFSANVHPPLAPRHTETLRLPALSETQYQLS